MCRYRLEACEVLNPPTNFTESVDHDYIILNLKQDRTASNVGRVTSVMPTVAIKIKCSPKEINCNQLGKGHGIFIGHANDLPW